MKRLTDEQVHDRLVAAADALGDGEPITKRGQTVMQTARRALTLLQIGLLKAQAQSTDQVEGVSPRPKA